MGLAGIDDLVVVDSRLAGRGMAFHMAWSRSEESVVELDLGWRGCSGGYLGPDSVEVEVGLAVAARTVVLHTVLAVDHSREGSQSVAQMEEALQAAGSHTEPVVAGLHCNRIAAVEEERLALPSPSTQAHSRLPGLDYRTLQTAHRGCYGYA